MKKRMKRILSLLMCTAIVLTNTIAYAEEMETSTLPGETEVVTESPTITVDIPEVKDEVVAASIPVTATVVEVVEDIPAVTAEETGTPVSTEGSTTTPSTEINSDSKAEDIKDVIDNLPIPETEVSGTGSTAIDPDTNTTISSTTTIVEGSDDQSSYKETTTDTTTRTEGETEITIKQETTVDGEYSYTETEIDSDPISVDFTGAEITETTIKTVGGETFTFEYSEYDEATNTTYYYTYEGTERKLVAAIVSAEVSVGDGDDVEISKELYPITGIEATYPETEDLTFSKKGDDEYAEPKHPAPDDTYNYYYAGTAGDSIYGGTVSYEGNKKDSTVDVIQFYLKNAETGQSQVAYCCDIDTYTKSGTWYTLENVEDATYYSEEDAKAIKAIALNGYWGTAEGTGSLTQLRKSLGDYYDQYVKDNPTSYLATRTNKDDFIASITAGEAQTATQIAIWYYGKSSSKIKEITGYTSNHSYTGDWQQDENGKWFRPTTADKPMASIDFIKSYLLQCKLTEEEDKETEVLKAGKFISSIGLTVNDKVENHVNNKDDDPTNDAYNVDITFALAVTVTDNDDLVVKVIDKEGNVLKICRLAGDNTSSGYDVITPDSNGKYVIKGLELVEGHVDFNMVLQGAQYLEEGVYLYTAEGGYSTAQTFVSIAEGHNIIDLSTKVSMDFDVDDASFKATKEWNSKKSTVELIPVETEPETQPETTPETETEKQTESETEPVTEKQTETEPITEKQTEPVTEKQTEPITEKETELVTEAQTELVTEESETELVTKPETNNNTESEAPVEVQSVKTGDETPVIAMLTLCFACGTIIIALAFREAKLRNRKIK